MELLGPKLDDVHYLGVDASSAVDVARDRFVEHGHAAAFLQSDIASLPLPPGSVDVVLAEGVLHHTDAAEAAFQALVSLLRHGGRFLFYVYRRKGPIREFTDDYVREKLRALSPQEGWDALLPLTRLGQQLGEIDVTLDLPDGIPLLDVPPGPITLQRFVYWHVFKAFHHPDLDIDELNHVNYDWYAPVNASRHTPEEVRGWCASAGLAIERERVEEAGVTIVARRASASA
jgi:SAM-dependent methyltransferase